MRYFFVFIVLSWGLLGCASSGPRAPVADLTLNSSQSPVKLSSSARKLKSYRVKKGDTLYAIAWKTGLDVKTLAKRNNLHSPYTIYPGQRLNLIEKKPVKYSHKQKATTKNAKTKPPSQKIDEKAPIRCTAQNCIKSVKNKLVEKKTKAYSGNQSNKKVAQPEKIKAQKTTTEKITTWRWPAKGKVSKSFSASQAGMKGISISNQRGTAIYATTSGQVVYAGSGLRGYGNLIIIKHNYDYLSAYAHNEKLLVGENEQIKAGQKIALMGDSGSDSVHLHFEIRYRGKSVDPLRYLTKR